MQSAAGGRKENEKITRAVQSRAQERPANENITRAVHSEAGNRKDNEKITRAVQSEVSGQKENEKITREVQSEAGGRKENEKITRAVQSRAQEHPVALSVRLLHRFLARGRLFSLFFRFLFLFLMCVLSVFGSFWEVILEGFGNQVRFKTALETILFEKSECSRKALNKNEKKQDFRVQEATQNDPRSPQDDLKTFFLLVLFSLRFVHRFLVAF